MNQIENKGEQNFAVLRYLPIRKLLAESKSITTKFDLERKRKKVMVLKLSISYLVNSQ